jgi:hypothetical protein
MRETHENESQKKKNLTKAQLKQTALASDTFVSILLNACSFLLATHSTKIT